MADNPRYNPSEEQLSAAVALLSKRSFSELDRLTASYVEKLTGKKWNDPAVLEKIRAAIMSQKDAYWKEGKKRVVAYKGGYSVLSYMAYQMPGYVYEIAEYLLSLISAGLVRKHIRVLDLGAGPGTASAAVLLILSAFPELSAEICAVEVTDTHREAYAYLIPELAQKLGSSSMVEKPQSMNIMETLPEGEYDLIICANVLNELPLDTSGKASLLQRIAGHLVTDGSLLVFEPADLENATVLRDVSREAKAGGLTVYDPCNDLRGVACRVSPCWSFRTYENIRATPLMKALAADNEEAYRFINTDVKFAYAVFRTDGHRRCGYRIPADAKRARLSQIKRHEGKRIHVTVSVMSADIGDQKTYLYLVCDGSGSVPCYLALPAYHRTPEHEALLTATYGSVVAVDSVLVRWNEKQKAYNLLMGRNSWCRMIAGTATGKPCPDKIKELMKKTQAKGKGQNRGPRKKPVGTPRTSKNIKT
ncbi:MAG TPA: class I SAM-dependent methyltransferase [Methanocorpusculum sp.]|nr:class I SAM-dependent methyltransferase [Methanocorpusculum sp.]